MNRVEINGRGATAGRSVGAVRDPVRVRTTVHERLLPHVKHVATLGLAYHWREARRDGFDDALFLDRDGFVSEGSIWNIGFFDGDGMVWPAAPALRGITMQLVQAGLRREGVPSTTRPGARYGAALLREQPRAARRVTVDRDLTWEGCRNVRDLGGFRAAGGCRTRRGAVVRSDSPVNLSPAGWSALRGPGIRTIVDLRNDEERSPTGSGAAGLAIVHLPLDDLADTAFWRHIWDEGLDGTPLYYRPFLQRKPERCAAAVAAVADAPPGGVLVHCTIGRDRTGLVALLLLALVGVAAEDIADDYELSNRRLEPLRASPGRPGRAQGNQGNQGNQGRGPSDALDRRNTTARQVIRATLEVVDVETCLRAAGLSQDRLTALRDRLLEPLAGPAAAPTATRRVRRSGASGR